MFGFGYPCCYHGFNNDGNSWWIWIIIIIFIIFFICGIDRDRRDNH